MNASTAETCRAFLVQRSKKSKDATQGQTRADDAHAGIITQAQPIRGLGLILYIACFSISAF
jgi:hypothetical protein